MRFICDRARHLVCLPFSVENLHQMAAELGIKKCWFHASARHPHYDIPKGMIAEVMAKCEIVSSRDILKIMQGKKES